MLMKQILEKHFFIINYLILALSVIHQLFLFLSS